MTASLSKNPFPVIRVRRDGSLVSFNRAAQSLLKDWKWFVGEPCPEKSLQRQIRAIYHSESSDEIEISVKNCSYLFTLVPLPEAEMVELHGYNLTRRKKNELALELEKARLESFFNILKFKAHNPQIFLDYALEEAIKLTKSKLGYIYFYDEAKKEFTLNSWSRKVMEVCSITEPQTIYTLEKTGFWGEVIRQRQPMILNDFQTPNPLRKGYPAGHAHLEKFMSLPVYLAEKIVAVVGVANKETNYDETDLRQLQWLMEAVWKIVEEKKIEAGLKNQLHELQQKAETLIHLNSLAERQIQRLTSLHTIEAVLVLSDGQSHRTGLEILLEQALQQLQVHAAAILRTAPQGQTLENYVHKGFRYPPPPYIHLESGAGCAHRALSERRPVSVQNLLDEPAAKPELARLEREGFIAYIGIPLITHGQILGLLELYHRDRLELDQEGLNYAERLANQAANAINGSDNFERLQRANLDLALAYDRTLEGWAQAVEIHECEVDGHTKRMANLAVQIGNCLGIGKDDLIHIYRGALLHDVGALGIPDEILHKVGPLNPEEWEVISRHPQAAYEILAPIPFLKAALEIPYCHHEKWDGSGYPRGLKETAIPLAARIFAVVDAWDALISRRAHRQAVREEEALAQIAAQAGKQFDPEIVEVFLKLATTSLNNAGAEATQLFLW